ncbi:MAG: type secretion protein EccB [Actinotalea sp.]|nr:type secretion protein EccB [Actinotalea sp.]
MASKKELLEAQTFSRRRLLTAFVSGAPGGRELEPTKPLRAVVGGVALTGLLVGGSLAFGLLSPTLPAGWDHNSLIVTKEGGSRYVAIDQVLYPVLNTTSARLLIPAGEFDVVSVGEDKIAQAERGPTVGIPGAPDDLPAPAALVRTGWLSCTGPRGGSATVLSTDEEVGALVTAGQEAVDGAAAGAAGQGVLVQTAGDVYLVTGGLRHLVPRDQQRSGVLRAIGRDTETAWEVDARWLNLFPPGSALDPVALEGSTAPVPAGTDVPPGAVVGSVLAVDGDEDQRYVITADGDLAPLSPFAERLYRLGAGAGIGEQIEVTAAQIASLSTTSAAAPADWPAVRPVPLPEGEVGCALLVTGTSEDGEPLPAQVHLVGTDEVVVEPGSAVVQVDVAAGALVEAVAGTGLRGTVQLVDRTGTAFALPDAATTDVLAQLGYAADDVTPVPQAWLSLFATGPALSRAAAEQQSPGAG